jgi:hypothetical protein
MARGYTGGMRVKKITVSKDAWGKLQTLIKRPRPPNKYLTEAARRFREEVKLGRIKIV